MAKKTVVNPEDEGKKNYTEDLQKLIEKKYGSVLFDGSHIRDNAKVLIPTTPTLDISLRGGIPEGSWTLITGQKKTGKSTLALQIAANAQKMGRHVYYLDIEHRFAQKNLTTVRHLQTTPDLFTLIASTKEKILSAQDFLNIAVDIISSHPKCVLILDSISVLCSDNEMSKEIGEAARPEGPKMFGQFCRKMASVVPINDVTFIGMLHLIANTSGYGAAWMEDGGTKIQYQADTKLKCKTTWQWEEGNGEDKKKIGQMVDWEVAFSANGPPGDVVKTYLRYGFGYDDIWEIITLGIDFGLIAKAGAWFQFQPTEGEPIKVQGQAKLYEYFTNNPNELDILYTSIKGMAM